MENRKKGKEFIFGDNVSSKYGVAFGLGLLDLVKVLSVPTAIAIILFLIPPHTIISVIIRFFAALVLFGATLAFFTSTPIPSRPNISLRASLEFQRKYASRQRLYFKKGRERSLNIEAYNEHITENPQEL